MDWRRPDRRGPGLTPRPALISGWQVPGILRETRRARGRGHTRAGDTCNPGPRDVTVTAVTSAGVWC